MAHEISIRANGFAEMAFVGETPWHELGQRMNAGASIEEWRVAAGMDWTAIERPVYVESEGFGRIAFPDRKGLYRSDTGAPLAIVGDGFHCVQPGQALEFFRDLAADHGWQIHTAGVLRGGRKLWALAKNGREESVKPGDRVRQNLLLATALDGSMKTIVCNTGVRVVCANTLRIALDALKAGDAIATSHRSMFDAARVKRELGLVEDQFTRFMEQARRMAETPIALDEARATLRELFGQPVPVIAKADAAGAEFAKLMARVASIDDAPKLREHRNVVRTLELFNGEARGAEHASARGTRWGLLNAVTEFVDHEASRTNDGRLESAWFGEGNRVKSQALALLTA